MILVAGGSGRLGTLVVRRLDASGLNVRVLTRDRKRGAHLASGRVDIVEGDVRDAGNVARAMAGVRTVVSAIHGFGDIGKVSPASVDRDGNRNLVDAAAAVTADVVLMSIVGASADHPIDLFRMKYAAEAYLRASGVPWTIVRATAFAEFWLDLLEQTARGSGRPVIFGRGVNPINFVSVGDVAALVERVVVDPSTRGTTFEIGGPENISFNDLAEGMKAPGHMAAPRHIPLPMLRLAAALLGPVQPNRARQIRAGIAMDTMDFTFVPTAAHRSFPDLRAKSVLDVLARRGANAASV